MGKAIILISKIYLAQIIPLPEGSVIEENVPSDNPDVLKYVISHPELDTIENGEALPELDVVVDVSEFGELTPYFKAARK